MPFGGSEKTMSFPSQLAPHGLPALQIVIGAPPVVAILFNAESELDQKPTHCPSGEKNGFDTPPLVPAIGRASISDMFRKYSWVFATYTIFLPSGEIATRCLA